MAKLPPVPYSEFTQALKKSGFKQDRSKGGHETWERKESVTIPIHGDINGALARRLNKEHCLNMKRFRR